MNWTKFVNDNRLCPETGLIQIPTSEERAIRTFYDEICRRAKVKAVQVVMEEGGHYAAVKMEGCHFDAMKEIMKELKLL